MAFTWILGKRNKPADDNSASDVVGAMQEKLDDHAAIDLTEIKLSIEDGLLMVFGPEGDPIPPLLLKEACVKQPCARIRLPNGFAVDHKRLIDVIDAQQKGKLADQATDRWIKAMLGAEGVFEPTPEAHLAEEDTEEAPVSGNELTIETSDGEAMTLCDAHPGNARRVPPLKVLVNGQSMSIGAILDQLGRSGSSATKSPVIARRGEHISLLLDKATEAKLETASSTWDDEAKTDLFLNDGSQASMDDLMVLLEDTPSHESNRREMSDAQKTCRLLPDGKGALDLDRATIVLVSGMPEGWSLTKGLQSEQGSWMMDPSDLMDTSVAYPDLPDDAVTLEINVISIVGPDGSLDKQSCSVAIPPLGNEGIVEQTRAQSSDDVPSFAVPLAFDMAETCLAISADALLLRGLPEGVELSAGLFDSSVGGWVLKPDQLQDLVIQGLGAEDQGIEIELKAIRLDQAGRPRAEVIAKKTVPIAA